MNRLTATSVPPTADSTTWRSAFGDIRSCSRNRRRKCRIRSRSRMADDHIGDVRGGSFGIHSKHELREDFLERSAAHQTLEGRDGVVGDDCASMNHDYPITRLLDQLEDVRAVE